MAKYKGFENFSFYVARTLRDGGINSGWAIDDKGKAKSKVNLFGSSAANEIQKSATILRGAGLTVTDVAGTTFTVADRG